MIAGAESTIAGAKLSIGGAEGHPKSIQIDTNACCPGPFCHPACEYFSNTRHCMWVDTYNIIPIAGEETLINSFLASYPRTGRKLHLPSVVSPNLVSIWYQFLKAILPHLCGFRRVSYARSVCFVLLWLAGLTLGDEVLTFFNISGNCNINLDTSCRNIERKFYVTLIFVTFNLPEGNVWPPQSKFLTGGSVPLTGGLFGCEILFHDACAVREFGMRDEVRHSAAPRV